jgi:hypothetical protein
MRKVIASPVFLCFHNGQFRNEVINPLTIMGDSWKNLEIVFLVRGVDPYTDTQNIEYDLSRLFGYSFGQGPKVSGQFFMNIPIQPNSGSGTWWYDGKTPESHSVTYTTSKLYHQPFNFNTGTQFSSVTSNTIRYYSSLDKSTNTITASGVITATQTTPNRGEVKPNLSLTDVASVTLSGGSKTINSEIAMQRQHRYGYIPEADEIIF